MGLGERVDKGGERLLKRVRILVWNSILGILLFLLANNLFDLGMPYLAWPLLLAALFGVPGALAAIILWVIVT